MSNIYLEKIAAGVFSLGNLGRAADAIKSTMRTAGGREFRPLAAKAQGLSNNIAKYKNENSVLGKATGKFDPSKFKSQAQFDLASNRVNGPRMSSNMKKINNRQGILDRVNLQKDQAQLNMHKAQAKVGAGVIGVGLAGGAIAGSRKNDNSQYQNY